MITINNLSSEVQAVLKNKMFGVQSAVAKGDVYNLPSDIAASLAVRESTTDYTAAEYQERVKDGRLSAKAAKAFTSSDGLIYSRVSPYVVICCTDGKELALGTLTSYGTCNTAAERSAAEKEADGRTIIDLKGAAEVVLNGIAAFAGKPIQVVYRNTYDQELKGGRKLSDMTITAFSDEIRKEG